MCTIKLQYLSIFFAVKLCRRSGGFRHCYSRHRTITHIHIVEVMYFPSDSSNSTAACQHPPFLRSLSSISIFDGDDELDPEHLTELSRCGIPVVPVKRFPTLILPNLHLVKQSRILINGTAITRPRFLVLLFRRGRRCSIRKAAPEYNIDINEIL
jgi:hypothetical protein